MTKSKVHVLIVSFPEKLVRTYGQTGLDPLVSQGRAYRVRLKSTL